MKFNTGRENYNIITSLIRHLHSCDFLMAKSDHGLHPSSSEKVYVNLQSSRKPLFSLAGENTPTIVFIEKKGLKVGG